MPFHASKYYWHNFMNLRFKSNDLVAQLGVENSPLATPKKLLWIEFVVPISNNKQFIFIRACYEQNVLGHELNRSKPQRRFQLKYLPFTLPFILYMCIWTSATNKMAAYTMIYCSLWIFRNGIFLLLSLYGTLNVQGKILSKKKVQESLQNFKKM